MVESESPTAGRSDKDPRGLLASALKERKQVPRAPAQKGGRAVGARCCCKLEVTELLHDRPGGRELRREGVHFYFLSFPPGTEFFPPL